MRSFVLIQTNFFAFAFRQTGQSSAWLPTKIAFSTVSSSSNNLLSAKIARNTGIPTHGRITPHGLEKLGGERIALDEP